MKKFNWLCVFLLLAMMIGSCSGEDSDADTMTTDITAPADVTNLTASAGALVQAIDISWTNPADSDFKGVEITWTPAHGNHPIDSEGLPSANSSNQAKSLNTATTYQFTVKAYDSSGNKSAGVTVNATTN